MRAAVLVPVKAFHRAKTRLARVLEPDARAALAQATAARVLAAAAPLPAWVVCDDPDVAAFAREHGAQVLFLPARGLNRAVTEGVARLGSFGVEEVVVVHADLPWARELAALVGFDGVTLVPDTRRDGTNAIVVPARCGFGFSYGPGSFRRHHAEAERLGLRVRVLELPWLAEDLDTVTDLERVMAWAGGRRLVDAGAGLGLVRRQNRGDERVDLPPR
jgi:2-phospho-L-lactate guanylyltransferase